MATIRLFCIMPVVRLVDILFGGTVYCAWSMDLICFQLKRLLVVEGSGKRGKGRREQNLKNKVYVAVPR